MFNSRWYRIASLIVLLGAGCAIGSALVPEAAPVRVALAQGNDDDFITKIVPILKTIKDLGESIKAMLPDRTTTTTTVVDSGASTPVVTPASLMVVPDQSVAQQLSSLRAAQTKRNPMLASLTQHYRVYVSAEIGRCKAALDAGDKSHAETSCRLAQEKIAACEKNALEMNFDALQLTSQYEPMFGSVGSFGFLYCSQVTRGLADPGQLLRAADLQLADGDCYRHVDRMEAFARTGTMPSFGKTIRLENEVIATPDEYRRFIQRRCTTRIGDEAVRALIEAEDAPKAPQAPLTNNALPKRADTGLASAFDEAIDDVDRKALDREPAERQASDTSDQAAQAKKAAAEEKAESDRLAAAEIEDRARLGAIEKARLRKEFDRTLATASDGELFALADERRMAGDTGEEHELLRALMSRFANSPLLMAAAKALGGETAEAAVVTPPSPRTSVASARSCVSLISDVINVMNEVPDRSLDHEQQVWRQQVVVRTVNAMPNCSAADRATGARGLTQAQAECRTARGSDCANGLNRLDDAARINAAAQNAIRLASGGAAEAAVVPPPVPDRPAPSPRISVASARSCVSLIGDVVDIINEAPDRSRDYEQDVWRAQIAVRTVNAMPNCSAADRATGVNGLTQAQAECRAAGRGDCVNGQNRLDDAARINAAAQNAIRLASGGAATSAPAQSNANSGGGAPASASAFAACVSGEDTAVARLNTFVAANSESSVLMTRALIATIDATRASYRRCLPDPRAQDKINGLSAPYDQALQSCRQFSTDERSCLVSPFDR